MNKFLLSTTVLACCVQFAVAQTEQTELVPGEPKLTGKFVLVDNVPTVSLELIAPTEAHSWDTPKPVLTDPIARIEVTRSSYAASESDEPVKTFTNVTPGETFTFTDTEFQTGYQYSYNARAYNSENESGYAAYLSIYTGIRPAKPEFVSVTTTGEGGSPVTFVVKAPATDDNGAELSVPLTSLTLKQYTSDYKEIDLKNIDNPEPGKEYTLSVDLVEGESYAMRLYASTAYGTSDYTSKSVFVGKDVPASPKDLKAAATDKGVELTWTAPTEGWNGGYFDPAATLYKVERVTSVERKSLAEGIAECKYTDDCADITAPTEITYVVTAYNAQGEGGSKECDETLIVGPAIKLPFVENFNNVIAGSWYDTYLPENLWSYSSSSGYGTSWSFDGSNYEFEGTGVDGDTDNEEGFAYCSHSYGDAGDSDDIISAKISLADAKCPVLTFHYVTFMGATNRIAVKTRTDETDTDIADFGISEVADADGEANETWIKKTLALKEAAGKEINLVFRAYLPDDSEYGNQNNVFIDGIYLDDYPPVENVTVENEETGITLTWEAPANSTVTADAYDVTVNGKEAVRVTEPKFEITPEPDVDYTVTILAHYGEIESVPSEAIEFSSKLSSILSISKDGAVSVEYFDMTGRKVASPAEGMILVKRSTLADGEQKAEKVIYKNR